MSELLIIEEALDAVIAEASAFSEHDEETEDAFRRIVRLAQNAKRQLNTIEVVE